MKKRAGVVSVFTLVVLMACYKLPVLHPTPEPSMLAAPRDAVWPVIIELAAEQNFHFAVVEAESGIITTQRMRMPFDRNMEWWDCGEGGMGVLTAQVQRVLSTVTIVASAVGDSTRLAVHTSPIAENGARCTSRGGFEREFVDRVRDQSGLSQ